MEIKPYLWGEVIVKQTGMWQPSGLCVQLLQVSTFFTQGEPSAGQPSQLQHSTINSHSKKPPGNISTGHRHLQNIWDRIKKPAGTQIPIPNTPLLRQGVLLPVAWNKKFVFVLARTQLRSCPRWALWLSGASNLTRCSQGLPPTLTLHSWAGFCNLNILTPVNIWCKHLTLPYSPATRIRTSDHAFKHFADKNILYFKNIFHSHSQPAKIYFL